MVEMMKKYSQLKPLLLIREEPINLIRILLQKKRSHRCWNYK
jgi:hypothetical protein